eukprot:TRINITY_DN17567_c2_g1_i1.p1 TRINITY_DN17567_c2_g1~~TRINITY_DN17567_c2_g1_i1.p1  ORF type:complete len:395 (+),score=18.73 TRINITY_DN17567_c2_g1_i1:277-1461(+)
MTNGIPLLNLTAFGDRAGGESAGRSTRSARSSSNSRSTPQGGRASAPSLGQSPAGTQSPIPVDTLGASSAAVRDSSGAARRRTPSALQRDQSGATRDTGDASLSGARSLRCDTTRTDLATDSLSSGGARRQAGELQFKVAELEDELQALQEAAKQAMCERESRMVELTAMMRTQLEEAEAANKRLQHRLREVERESREKDEELRRLRHKPMEKELKVSSPAPSSCGIELPIGSVNGSEVADGGSEAALHAPLPPSGVRAAKRGRQGDSQCRTVTPSPVIRPLAPRQSAKPPVRPAATAATRRKRSRAARTGTSKQPPRRCTGVAVAGRTPRRADGSESANHDHIAAAAAEGRGASAGAAPPDHPRRRKSGDVRHMSVGGRVSPSPPMPAVARGK